MTNRFLPCFMSIALLGMLADAPKLHAQDRSRFKVGFRMDYSFIDELLLSQETYKPVLLAGHFSFPLGRQLKRGGFYGYIEPQINPVFIVRNTREFEYGLNFGLGYEQYLNENFSLFGAAGAGPHYISMADEKQAQGFLFSDNFFLGCNLRLPSIEAELSSHLRFRHLSNAGLKEPNKGIDNFFFGISFLKLLY